MEFADYLQRLVNYSTTSDIVSHLGWHTFAALGLIATIGLIHTLAIVDRVLVETPAATPSLRLTYDAYSYLCNAPYRYRSPSGRIVNEERSTQGQFSTVPVIQIPYSPVDHSIITVGTKDSQRTLPLHAFNSPDGVGYTDSYEIRIPKGSYVGVHFNSKVINPSLRAAWDNDTPAWAAIPSDCKDSILADPLSYLIAVENYEPCRIFAYWAMADPVAPKTIVRIKHCGRGAGEKFLNDYENPAYEMARQSRRNLLDFLNFYGSRGYCQKLSYHTVGAVDAAEADSFVEFAYSGRTNFVEIHD